MNQIPAENSRGRRWTTRLDDRDIRVSGFVDENFAG